MKQSNSQIPGIAIGIFTGALISILVINFMDDSDIAADKTESVENEAQPLYWVAPMDPNYKRDKPGKSPMGMDLIPVYADTGTGSSSGPGTISVAPEVVNNLGVRTATALRKQMHAMVRTVGYVQYDEDRLIHIHPRVKGWIETLHVKAAGDPVEKGQALYELYSPELVNAQEELLLALNRDNDRLIRAAEDRLKALQISPEVIKDLKTRRAVSQTTTFYAPQAGVVDNLNIREGFFVQPGTTLMSIGALDDVWVEAEVFEGQAMLVEVGMPVTMSLEYLPGRQWQGQVDYIYPSLDEETRTLRVRLRFRNSDGVLQPNMFAQVVFHAPGQGEALVVPKEAVIRTGNQDRVVLALGEGRFKSIAITRGRVDEEYAEILTGLSEGDTVVTSAQFLLDSESSKTSDFKRMENQASDTPDSVWAEVSIEGRMEAHRMITVSHQPIPEWDWPAMKMDFTVADHLDFSALKTGLSLHVELSKVDQDQIVVSAIHVPNADTEEEVAEEKVVQRAAAGGIINRIDVDSRIANVSRGPIEKWNRPAATLDFLLDETVNINDLSVGDRIDFRFEVRGAEFVIVEINSPSHQPKDPHAGH
jgi:membrane fusion protein, copper/silver efflux system